MWSSLDKKEKHRCLYILSPLQTVSREGFQHAYTTACMLLLKKVELCVGMKPTRTLSAGNSFIFTAVWSTKYFCHIVVHVVDAHWANIITLFKSILLSVLSWWPRLLEQRRKAYEIVLPVCFVLLLTCAYPQKFLECGTLGKRNWITL